MVEKPNWINPSKKELATEVVLVCDHIQDPGNLGTIIRTADWFGIKHVVCSTDSADVFGPKALQATMGSVSRVNVIYTNLESFIDQGYKYLFIKMDCA